MAQDTTVQCQCLYNNLTEESAQILQSDALSVLNVELKQHQKAAIHAMMELETKGYVDAVFKYYSNKEKLLRIETQIGILGDKVGSGKTLIIVSLLIEKPDMIIRPLYYASDLYTTIREVDYNGSNVHTHKPIRINLIIVPKSIHHQWVECFEKQVTNFRYVSIKDASERPNVDRLVDNLRSTAGTADTNNTDVRVLLCNDTTAQYVFDVFGSKNYMFERLIIDEADTIKIGSIVNSNIRTNFTWLVTGTTNGVAYSNKKYIKEIFDRNMGWLPDFITVKNSDDFMSRSMALPKPNRITVQCITPNEINILATHIPKDIMKMINAGNVEQAAKRLNCNIGTADSIYKVIAANYERAINNKTLELEAEQKKKYISRKTDTQGTKGEQIESAQKKKKICQIEKIIELLKKKQAALKKSIFESNGKVCPICMSNINDAQNSSAKIAVVDCCGCKYCFSCITNIIAANGHKCPACMRKITTKKIHVMEAESDTETDDDDDDDDDDDTDDTDLSDSDSDSDLESDQNKDRAQVQARSDVEAKTYRPSSKLDTLQSILTSDKKTERKFLIFADYLDTFDKIRYRLDTLNIKYGVLGGGGKAVQIIEDFKSNKISIIMLNAQNFGAGLNLQCATDIVLYHRFSKRMEEQIIGRGQRMGRDSTLNVYYLCYDNEINGGGVFDGFGDVDDFEDFDYQAYLEMMDDDAV